MPSTYPDSAPKDPVQDPRYDPGRIASWVAGPLALASLGFAGLTRWRWPDLQGVNEAWLNAGTFVVALWILFPPVWFWSEWVFLRHRQDKEDLKYTQELARNIWIALVLVLAFLLKLQLRPG